MPAIEPEVPLVAIHNNLETFYKFLQRAEDPEILRKRFHRGERGIFWLGDPKLLFVTAASPAADQVCRRWGYPGTLVVEPTNPTPQLSLDILREPQLLARILEHAGPGRTIRLIPYATTREFLQLAAELRGRGLTILLPESPSPEKLWLRD
jgi:phosphoribosylglycinamide formyltransferase 2